MIYKIMHYFCEKYMWLSQSLCRYYNQYKKGWPICCLQNLKKRIILECNSNVINVVFVFQFSVHYYTIRKVLDQQDR